MDPTLQLAAHLGGGVWSPSPNTVQLSSARKRPGPQQFYYALSNCYFRRGDLVSQSDPGPFNYCPSVRLSVCPSVTVVIGQLS